MVTLSSGLLEYGMATRVLAGQKSCGDAGIIAVQTHRTLVAAVDGLGHGQEAAAAAVTAASTIRSNASLPLHTLLQRCHQNLLRTRGATISVAAFDVPEETMTWTGIGNVEGVLLHSSRGEAAIKESLMLRAGVVGRHLPPLFTSTVRVTSGDTLIFSTDGIESGYTSKLFLGSPAQRLADSILSSRARESDDALVVVARYLGNSR